MRRGASDRAVSAGEMMRLDRYAIEKGGIPSILLMERAGRGLAEEVIRYVKSIKRRQRIKPTVAIFCGKGNNGGDAMVCARYLLYEEIPTRVFIIDAGRPIRGDAAVNLKILEGMGAGITHIICANGLKKINRVFCAEIIVDGVFGIGFKGEAKGIYKEAIEFINRAGAYRFSVDIPSGLDATTGEAKGPCVKADETIAMGFAKRGFYIKDGPRFTGRIKVIDIGLTD